MLHSSLTLPEEDGANESGLPAVFCMTCGTRVRERPSLTGVSHSTIRRTQAESGLERATGARWLSIPAGTLNQRGERAAASIPHGGRVAPKFLYVHPTLRTEMNLGWPKAARATKHPMNS
jgi:hypothetical protein